MNDKLRKLISDSAIDMWESLRRSIEQAGGSFNKEHYMKMNVSELISILCTNSIRFTYVQPKCKGEYKQEWCQTNYLEVYKEAINTQVEIIKEQKKNWKISEKSLKNSKNLFLV